MDEAKVGEIVQVFGLDDGAAAELSKRLAELPLYVERPDYFNTLIAALGPVARTLARLQRVQSALAEFAEAFRALNSRSAILLRIVYDYRVSTEKKNFIPEWLFRNPMFMYASIVDIEKALSFEGPFELLHDLPEHRREMFAESGVQWLVDLLESMKRPIEQILEFERRIPYGAPGKRNRNSAIFFLAQSFERIFGQEPTPTPGGNFVLLCELALDAIGLQTEGMEKAVARILRLWKAHVRGDPLGTHESTRAVVGAG